MDRQPKKRLEQTYDLVRKSFPDITIDSLDVVKQVEEYRRFWKPEKVNVILLAESHVYTDDFDFASKLDKRILDKIVASYPSRLVRFVYCLGYGENQLLETATTKRKNTGTPQFWKIFCSCVAESQEDLGFWRILRKGTPAFAERIQNKIRILEKLRNKGIWLLDASVVGLYGNKLKRGSPGFKQIISLSWNSYVANIVESALPKYIIVIGKGVAKTLASRLRVPKETIDLPQAHIPRQQQLDNFKRYNEICNAIVKGKPVPKRRPTPTDDGRNTELTTRTLTEEKLLTIGYRKSGSKNWTKGNRSLHVVTSSAFGERIRITWKEKWKDDYAVIYDYSEVKGPVCILPISTLFNSNFVKEKRKTEVYANSGFWWTQLFPMEHDLAKLVLSCKNRWDVL